MEDINDRDDEFQDKQCKVYQEVDMINSQGKGTCQPKFDMSIDKKIVNFSQSMKEIPKDNIIGNYGG